MKNMSTRRKLAIASWSKPREANVYAKTSLPVEEAERYMAYLHETTGEKITITHVIGKALGLALAKSPDLNGRLVFGGFKPYPEVSISFLVVTQEGKDLAKAKISHINQKSIVQIAKELKEKTGKIRTHRDGEFEATKPLLRWLPTFFIAPIVRFVGYLTGAVGIGIPALGLSAFPFGSCIITSVGMLDVEDAFPPHVPFSHVPFLVVIAKIRDDVVAKEGQVVIERRLPLMVNFDHRFLDGFRGMQIAGLIRNYLLEPWRLDGLEEKPY